MKHMRTVLILVSAPFIAAMTVAIPAHADIDLFSRETIHGRLDLRGVWSDAELTWLDEGFGKTRFGDGGDKAGLKIGNVALVWQPQFTWDLTGYVHAQANPGQHNGVDLVEAFVKWKPMPDSEWLRYSVRVGEFFPPISLENDGLAWTPTRTITPSAINSWVGEEVLVLGLEGTVQAKFDENEFRLTAAAFDHNDTSGTLLTYRGWAMHDELATMTGDWAIPKRGPAWWGFYHTQAPTTEPTREVDGRYGSYVRFDWLPPLPISVNVLYYDNHGNPTVVKEGQYGWRTRFVNIGATIDLDEETELLAQFMTGDTIMGHQMPDPGRGGAIKWMADVGYSAAYALLSHRLGGDIISGRIDWFQVDDRSFEFVDNNNEEGWAATVAYQLKLDEQFSLAFEALHLSSKKPARVDQGIDPQQNDTQFQTALRFDF